MKVIKIDVENRSVDQIDISKGLKAMYDAIGNGCSLVEVPIIFKNGDGLYIDEEGYLKEQIGGFSMKNWRHPLTGNALIIGTDDEGNSISAKSGVDEIRDQITFHPVDEMERWKERILNTPPRIINF